MMPRSAAAGGHSAGEPPATTIAADAAQPGRDGLARQHLGDFELLQPDQAAQHLIAQHAGGAGDHQARLARDGAG